MRSDQPHTPHAREIAGASWDPGQYLKFADHRLRPAVDLMARIPLTDPLRIYDLGCGTGNVTRMLADRWPAADVVGIDHSPQMLKQARATPSGVRWQHGDLAEWQPEETPSLLFSNAVIHWLPDHRSLITRLWSLLPPGGCLAVQAPMKLGAALAPPHARDARRRWRRGLAAGRRRAATRRGEPRAARSRLLLRPAGHGRRPRRRVDHRVPARPHRHGPRAGVGHRHQPAPDLGPASAKRTAPPSWTGTASGSGTRTLRAPMASPSTPSDACSSSPCAAEAPRPPNWWRPAHRHVYLTVVLPVATLGTGRSLSWRRSPRPSDANPTDVLAWRNGWARDRVQRGAQQARSADASAAVPRVAAPAAGGRSLRDHVSANRADARRSNVTGRVTGLAVRPDLVSRSRSKPRSRRAKDRFRGGDAPASPSAPGQVNHYQRCCRGTECFIARHKVGNG